MGGTTPKFAFPYPSSTDVPDGATQIKALADRVEAVIDQPFCRLIHNAGSAVNLANAVWANWGTALLDNDGGWVYTAGTKELTVPVTGKYDVLFKCFLAHSGGMAAGCRRVRLQINAVTVLQAETVQYPSTVLPGYGWTVMVSDILRLTAGQKIIPAVFAENFSTSGPQIGQDASGAWGALTLHKRT